MLPINISCLDYTIICDQLNNAWEFFAKEEMIAHLTAETNIPSAKVCLFVTKWYEEPNLRRRLSLAPMSKWRSWIKKIVA